MSVNWDKVRKEEWPVLETMTFLDAACVSFAPQRSVKAVKDFADMTARQAEANSSAHHIAMDSMRHKAYVEAAKLLNADEEEIALVESTSHGLNIAAFGIELADGDNIITTNLEFIQVALRDKTPNLRGVVVECSNLATYSRDLYEFLKIPIFDTISAANLLQYAVNPPHYI